jgi:hypothetical protein
MHAAALASAVIDSNPDVLGGEPRARLRLPTSSSTESSPSGPATKVQLTSFGLRRLHEVFV